MPHVNPTLPNDGETADAGDISVPFQALLAIFNGHIAGDNIEPGSLPWSVMAAFTNTIDPEAMTDSGNIEKFRAEAKIGFIASGLNWSNLGGLNGAMATGIFYSPTTGERLTIPAITTRAFTASKDTYISISPTGSMAYNEVANGATAPALGTDYSWVAKFATNATTITSINDIRQTKPFANQEGWIKLPNENGWADFGDATFDQGVFVKKDTNGMVHIKGILNGTSRTSPIVTTQLPLGYRPPKTVIYPCLAADYPARFDVTPTGQIKYATIVGSGAPTSPSFLSFSGSWYGEI
jgi:hypothetical protein